MVEEIIVLQKWVLKKVGENGAEKQITCPFSNLLEFVSCYVDVAKRIGHGEKIIQTDEDSEDYSKGYLSINNNIWKVCHFEEMDKFILCLVNRLDNSNIVPKSWMEFNPVELNELLCETFFDEYKENNDDVDKLKWPNIELYVFTKLQSLVCLYLDERDTFSIWTLWCKNDLIQYIYKCRFYSIIWAVYKVFGRGWFCHFQYGNNSFDPMFYKYGLYAVCSAFYCEESHKKILKELLMLRTEFTLSITATGTENDEENKIFLKKIAKLEDSIKKTEEQKRDFSSVAWGAVIGSVFGPVGILTGSVGGFLLRNKFMQFIDSIGRDFKHGHPSILQNEGTVKKTEQVLHAAIDGIRADNENYIEDVKSLTLAAIGDNDNCDSVDNTSIKEVWSILDSATRKNIKSSLKLCKVVDEHDLPDYYGAFNLLAEGLEGLYNRKIFAPFREKVGKYRKKIHYSSDNGIRTTEKILVGNKSITLGNLGYINNLLKLPNYGNSLLIKRLVGDIGDGVNRLINICDTVTKKQFIGDTVNIFEIRNAASHNDAALMDAVDKECYDKMVNILFDEPMKIMFNIHAVGLAYDVGKSNKIGKKDTLAYKIDGKNVDELSKLRWDN